MTLKAALAESYASGDEDGVTITAAQLDHASFEAPVFVVTGIDTATGEPAETVGLPIDEGGAPVPHTPCGFSFVRAGADHDGPTDGKVQMDNVSDLLHRHLIPTLTDQNPWAHRRSPMDMMRQGWAMSLFQASQQ